MENKNRESSVRWQGRTIEQFGYTLNLILGLAVAGIGYELTLLLSKEKTSACWQSCLLFISLIFLLISVGAALWCIISRLRDFRLTAEIARRREDGEADAQLQFDRSKSKRLGEVTWTLLWWQITAFALGLIFLMTTILGSLKFVM
jgi:hypothetical protein